MAKCVNGCKNNNKKKNNWAPSLKFMASFEVQMNCAFLESSAGFGSGWYFQRKVFIFRGHMLRGKIIMGTVNYEREKAPCIIFFITVTPRWISLWYLCGSFHMIANHFSNEASPSCQRRAVLSVTALTFWRPAPILRPSAARNPLRTRACCLSARFVSKYYPLPALSG